MLTLSFQAPEELNAQLEQLAREMDRSKAYLIRAAITEYLEDMEDWNEAKRIKAKNNPKENVSFADLKRRHHLD